MAVTKVDFYVDGALIAGQGEVSGQTTLSRRPILFRIPHADVHVGARIDVVEMLDGLMPGADRDLVKVWEKKNAHRFDNVMLKTKTIGAKATKAGIEVSFEGERAPTNSQVYDLVLVAVGRSPNGGKIAADKAGVVVTDRGFINVDKLQNELAGLGRDALRLTNVTDRFIEHLVVRHLGLTSLRNITFQLGFDGKYQRSTVKVGIVAPENRTGLATLITGASGFRSSWASVAKNSSFCRSVSRSRSARSRCSLTSVLVPNHRRIRPCSSRIGMARDRNQRYEPSAPRSGKVSSQISPVSQEC